MLHYTLELSLRTVPTIYPTIGVTFIGLTHINIAFSLSHSFHLISALSASRFTLILSTNTINHFSAVRNQPRPPHTLIAVLLSPILL